MNILITGGAGFIGSHLCEYLIKLGNKVSVVDDLSTGHLKNLENIIELIDFYQVNLEDFNLNDLQNIDVVVHLAAQVSVPLSINNFYTSSSSNLIGTIKMIDFCKHKKIPLVYASSSAIYGNLNIADDEKHLVDLLSPYATDKYVMELYCKVAYQLFQLPSLGLRFFNVYGPRQDPKSAYSGVISVFCDRLSKDMDITINGGSQTRDFVYVSDVVKSINSSIEILKQNPICTHVNVLTGRSVSIDYISDLISKSLKKIGNKKYADLPKGEPLNSNGTTNKMQSILQINPALMTKIEDGLLATINFIK